MPRRSHHPLALFSLVPTNDRARTVLNRPENEPFVWRRDDWLALDIGHIPSKKDKHTLATLGRGDDADVFVGEPSISKFQCSFEIDSTTNVVMLYDRSHSQTTQVLGGNATPFEDGRPRKVVVQKGLNTLIGMGGKYCNLIQFKLIWWHDPDIAIEKIRGRVGIDSGYEESLRLAQTVIDEANTTLPSRQDTRICTPESGHPKIRYATIGRSLGSGAFGTVYKAVDADSGRLMAVKVIERLNRRSQQRDIMLKREVQILAKTNHPHVIEYFGSQGWGGPRIEIFLGLNDGSLESLAEKEARGAAHTIFHQMPQALDHLESLEIIHRDVKPENILYVKYADGEYRFQLGNFGLSNSSGNAISMVGTMAYAAPEFQQKEWHQTHKADVWSLFVTMLWVLNVRNFRQMWKSFKNHQDALNTVLAASNDPQVALIKNMAIVNPEERPSAADLLNQCFYGVGRST